jgi:hypothetical protein
VEVVVAVVLAINHSNKNVDQVIYISNTRELLLDIMWQIDEDNMFEKDLDLVRRFFYGSGGRILRVGIYILKLRLQQIIRSLVQVVAV